MDPLETPVLRAARVCCRLFRDAFIVKMGTQVEMEAFPTEPKTDGIAGISNDTKAEEASQSVSLTTEKTQGINGIKMGNGQGNHSSSAMFSGEKLRHLPRRPAVDIEFQDVTYSVKESGCRKKGEKGLSNVSVNFPPMRFSPTHHFSARK